MLELLKTNIFHINFTWSHVSAATCKAFFTINEISHITLFQIETQKKKQISTTFLHYSLVFSLFLFPPGMRIVANNQSCILKIQSKKLLFFLFQNKNIWCGHSLEAPQGGT